MFTISHLNSDKFWFEANFSDFINIKLILPKLYFYEYCIVTVSKSSSQHYGVTKNIYFIWYFYHKDYYHGLNLSQIFPQIWYQIQTVGIAVYKHPERALFYSLFHSHLIFYNCQTFLLYKTPEPGHIVPIHIPYSMDDVPGTRHLTMWLNPLTSLCHDSWTQSCLASVVINVCSSLPTNQLHFPQNRPEKYLVPLQAMYLTAHHQPRPINHIVILCCAQHESEGGSDSIPYHLLRQLQRLLCRPTHAHTHCGRLREERHSRRQILIRN